MAPGQSRIYETLELVIGGRCLQLFNRGRRVCASWLVPLVVDWAGMRRLPFCMPSADPLSFAGRLLSRLLLRGMTCFSIAI